MSLESVVKLVAQHSSAISPSQTKIEKTRAEQEIVRRVFTSLMIGVAILGFGLFLLIVNKSFRLGMPVSLLASFLLLGGTGYAAFAVLNAIRKNASLHLRNGPKELPLTSPDKSFPTNPFPESLPSVTESTTQLIARDHERSSN